MATVLTADVEVFSLSAAAHPLLDRPPNLVRTVIRRYLLNSGHYKRLQIPHSCLNVPHVHIHAHVPVHVRRKCCYFYNYVVRPSMPWNTVVTYDNASN